MKVVVIDRDAQARTWGMGAPSVKLFLRTVEISDLCPRCGGRRGKPRSHRAVEDGDWYTVDVWDNPCGHVDSYKAVLTEARGRK